MAHCSLVDEARHLPDLRCSSRAPEADGESEAGEGGGGLQSLGLEVCLPVIPELVADA